MKNITHILSEEHQNILKVIDAMLSECDSLENGKELDKNFFERAIEFIKNYADTFHHAKEEDILFKVMLDNADGMHCNPIPVMLHEHDLGRKFVSSMVEGLKGNNTQLLIENARGYGFLLKDHIYKEDQILYPMAEEALSEEQKERVQLLYDEVEAGQKSHSELLQYFGLDEIIHKM
jgi:hemerythrin-like domain-containing protein